MPILVRPVREQLEHDRIIRLLLARYKRKHDSISNIAGEPPTTIVLGTLEFVPDLILLTDDKARKLEAIVEVETGESVNSLETLAQWAPYSRLRVPFHLYVPPQSLDTVRRLCRDHNVTVAELWTYHTNLDQVRFTMVQKATDAALAAARKSGIAGTPKLKVAPPPPPPAPPPPAPLAPPPLQPKAVETKAPVRTAAQKVALGKFVAAAQASAARHTGRPAEPPMAAPTAAAKTAASRAKLGAPPVNSQVAVASAPVKPVVKVPPAPATKVAAKPAKAVLKPVAKPAKASAKPAGKAPVKPAAKSGSKAPSKPAKSTPKPKPKPVPKPVAKKPAARSHGAKRR